MAFAYVRRAMIGPLRGGTQGRFRLVRPASMRPMLFDVLQFVFRNLAVRFQLETSLVRLHGIIPTLLLRQSEALPTQGNGPPVCRTLPLQVV